MVTGTHPSWGIKVFKISDDAYPVTVENVINDPEVQVHACRAAETIKIVEY